MYRGISIDLALRIFPFASRFNLECFLPDVCKVAEASVFSRNLLLVALATIRAETETFLPLVEECSRFNTSQGGTPFDLYDHRRDLGNQGPPDGGRFRGRGYVQLTGRANYTHFGPQIGLDLLHTPDLAALAFPAAQLLAAFLQGKREILESTVRAGDLAAARRAVNGGTHGLVRFRESFELANSLLPPCETPLN